MSIAQDLIDVQSKIADTEKLHSDLLAQESALKARIDAANQHNALLSEIEQGLADAKAKLLETFGDDHVNGLFARAIEGIAKARAYIGL